MFHYMQDPQPVAQPRIDLLYTNIGRGHPFYLDGIAEALIRRGRIALVRQERDVFDISRGLSRTAWRTARWLYRKGSSGGLIGVIYDRLRRNGDYNKQGLLSSILARDIRRTFADSDQPLIIAHPSLVGMLAGRPNLIYQHGELVAPGESLVRGASKVLAPTEDVALRFLAAGYDRSSVVVTGLCVEPAIVRQASDSFAARTERLASDRPLTGAFFSSGAEPSPHIDTLVDTALSALRNNHRVIVFARQGGKLARAAMHAMHLSRREFAVIDRTNILHQELPAAVIVEFDSRREENALSARLFPSLDYFVGPSHERSNWAVGLGLPLFMVEPCIGPFAPLNRDLLVGLGVGLVVGSESAADQFGSYVLGLRETGHLRQMAERGWGGYGIDGFDKIAEWLYLEFGGHEIGE